jgi:hypothetical protein
VIGDACTVRDVGPLAQGGCIRSMNVPLRPERWRIRFDDDEPCIVVSVYEGPWHKTTNSCTVVAVWDRTYVLTSKGAFWVRSSPVSHKGEE